MFPYFQLHWLPVKYYVNFKILHRTFKSLSDLSIFWDPPRLLLLLYHLLVWPPSALELSAKWPIIFRSLSYTIFAMLILSQLIKPVLKNIFLSLSFFFYFVLLLFDFIYFYIFLFYIDFSIYVVLKLLFCLLWFWYLIPCNWVSSEACMNIVCVSVMCIIL